MRKFDKILLIQLICSFIFLNLYENVNGQSSYNQRKRSNPYHLSNSELMQTDPTFPNTYSYFDSIRDYTNDFDFIVNAHYKHFQFQEVFSNNPQFKKEAYFNSAVFHESIYFENPQFHSVTDFSYAKFNSWAVFSFGVFDDKAIFNNSIFHGGVHFQNMTFKSIANFHEVNCESKADFTNSKFESSAIFRNAKFDSLCSFQGTQFNSLVDFQNVHFNSLIDFQSTQFNSTADFNGSKFNFKINFNNAILPDTLIFTNVTSLNSEIDFTSTLLNAIKKSNNKEYRCRISLVGSDISKIKINYNLFELYFPKGTAYEQKISIYEKLLLRFKDDGFLDSYKLLDIEYCNFKNRHNGNIFINWFQKGWWNYGYNKEFVVWWVLKIFLFFSFLNIFIYKKLQSKVYPINFPFWDFEYSLKRFSEIIFYKKNIINDKYTHLLRWLFSMFANLINSLIYTAIIFFGIKISIEKFKKFNIFTLYIFLIYCIGIFCFAYLFNIIIVK